MPLSPFPASPSVCRAFPVLGHTVALRAAYPILLVPLQLFQESAALVYDKIVSGDYDVNNEVGCAPPHAV